MSQILRSHAPFLCCLIAQLSMLQGLRADTSNNPSAENIRIVEFDEYGNFRFPGQLSKTAVALRAANPTHVLLLSHGWNNSLKDAVATYDELVRLIRAVAGNEYAASNPFIIGLHWPSLAWDSDSRNARSDAVESDLTTKILKSLPSERSARSYLSDVMRLEELVNGSTTTREQEREAVEILRRYSIPPESTEDRTIFDLGDIEALAELGSIRGSGLGTSLKDLFRVFTFWQMKKRSGVVGKAGGHLLVNEVLTSASRAKVFLVSHSFGGKLWLSAITTGALPRPVDGVVLLQSAISAFAFSEQVPDRQVPGGYRKVLESTVLQGPLVATYSSNDWPLTYAYPLGARIADQIGELERARGVSPYAALGAVGAQLVGSRSKSGELLRVPQAYKLSKDIWSMNGSEYIGGHTDYNNENVAWLIWSVLKTQDEVPPGSTRVARQKSATQLLTPESEPHRGEPRSGIQRALSTQSAMPPIQVKAYVAKGRTLSPQIERYITDGTTVATPRSVILDAQPDVLRLAQEDEAIQHMEIHRPPEFKPTRIVPFNRDARITHFVDDFLATFSDQTQRGKSVKIAIFDGGQIRSTHTEFLDNLGTSRVALHPSLTLPLSRHATHVAGTIGARGANQQARGMAEAVSIISLDWNHDTDNIQALADSIQTTNHSYGPQTGWAFNPEYAVWFWWGDTTISENEDASFGKYSGENQVLDDVLSAHPHLLTIVAAGNERNDEPIQPVEHYIIGKDPITHKLVWQRSSRMRNSDGFDNGGLDTIAGLGLCKNAICIGAIHDVVNIGDTIRTTEFSSWGPADDYRVKPDLVANGQELYSVSSAADDAYLELSGTSMASPTAAGITCLLVEHFRAAKGKAPSSAEIKAVMIHSATDAGNPGPDPIYGWGSINALAAGRVIAGRDDQSIILAEVASGAVYVYHGSGNGGSRVRVTLCWTDPAGEENLGGLDDDSPALVNDLDLQVTSPDGKIQYPYSLVHGSALSPATAAGPNHVDNVEMVDAAEIDGAWKVEVKGSHVQGSKQVFALVVTGLRGGEEPSAPSGDKATQSK